MTRPRQTRSTRRRRAERRSLAAVLGVASLLLVMASLLLWFGGVGQVAQGSPLGGPFRLTDAAGRPVTDRSFPGRYQLVYFGYTSCPDVCPTTLGAVADAMARLGPRADLVQPLFITLDPQRDTAAVLHSYLAAVAPQVIGLTGSAADIAAVARAFRIQSMQMPDGAGRYTVDHSSVLFLIDPAGHVITPIRADLPGQAIAGEITRQAPLLAQAPSLTVDHVWARATASVAQAGAIYMTIAGHGAADRLVSLSTPVAAAAELHETTRDGDIMRMRPVDGLEIAPGRPVTLAPGGYHVMLTGLKAPLKQGEHFPLTLVFAHAGTLQADVIVEAAGAGGMGMRMQ